MADEELYFLPAHEMVELVSSRELSATELLEIHLARIEQVNSKINAIVTLDVDRARESSRSIDSRIARGESVRPLEALPIAHKDLTLTKGLTTTFGSTLFENFVPDQDALIVTRLKDAGAVTIGKTNTPEFGAGSQTFNNVFGATVNPYDCSLTCGGSSGGAAAALATGMIPLADGSDLGGSLRNPAAFCNVVGLRPSTGRVPAWPTTSAWFSLSVLGPMGRTVQDIALMMSVISGFDDRCPISISEPGSMFCQQLDRDFKGTRVAWSPTLGGLPVDQQVTDVLVNARSYLEELGCIVEEVDPDLSGADEIFLTLRAWHMEATLGELLKRHPSSFKDTLAWNIGEGLKLSGPDLGRAERLRTSLFERLNRFMQTYEFIICPVTQVLPFDVTQPFVREINGIQLENYLEWMKSCFQISVTGHPALSVPAGFSSTGLPVGMQIVGRYRDDFGVMQLGHAYEQVTEFWKNRPDL